ncbi:TANK-binding kinase 1-binding protein 1 isoform X5 [Rhineura floridana]|uniref:TANK-binding kinase 1-binding protein 1 isoform X5 n=1 Tax=Rhineura floridana TaxID=261503 RepID=UPI002AC86B19|nr:TANK-binding kinase 1-binding protein 1 isoform X5 [Rhineura floridana]
MMYPPPHLMLEFVRHWRFLLNAHRFQTAMDSMFEDDISILTQDALVQDDDWLDSPNTDLSSEMCSASHFALITAYDDIKNRLTGLERENASLKRKLKMYEIKFPLISEFGEECIFPSYDSKETSLLKSEKANLQQQLNQFQRELQKSKEREEQLGEMIQAYEKLCVEKTDLESELGQMRALVETHLSRIRSLEQQLRQRDGNSFQNLNSQLQNQEVQYLSLHGSHVLDRSMNWQSPRGLEQVEGLEVQRLEVELEETRQEVQNSQHREEQLKAECERLQAEVKQLQETRAQGEPGTCLHRANRGVVPLEEPELSSKPDSPDAYARAGHQWWSTALSPFTAPLSCTAMPLSCSSLHFPCSAREIFFCPAMPVSSPAKTVASTALSIPCASASFPSSLPVSCLTASFPSPTAPPVFCPAALLTGPKLLIFCHCLTAQITRWREKHSGSGLLQTLEPPHQSKLPRPPELLRGERCSYVPAEPLSLAAARSFHLTKAPSLRRSLCQRCRLRRALAL